MLTHSTDLLKQTLERLTDVNIAEESTRFARDQILRQTATAMLAQPTSPQPFAWSIWSVIKDNDVGSILSS